MSAWKSVAVAVTLLAGAGSWIAFGPNYSTPVPARAPEVSPAKPAEPPAAALSTAAPAAPSVAAQTTARQEPPPATAVEPAVPKPRSEASRAAGRRDFTNPLAESYPPGTPPPRRAANAEPEVAADFDRIGRMLLNYRSLTGGNPVGTNAEIMQALMGGNPKGAQLGPPAGQQLNANGELIDRWGTPYFFHQLSKDLMEIHSAGPDRRMGNADDIVSD